MQIKMKICPSLWKFRHPLQTIRTDFFNVLTFTTPSQSTKLFNSSLCTNKRKRDAFSHFNSSAKQQKLIFITTKLSLLVAQKGEHVMKINDHRKFINSYRTFLLAPTSLWWWRWWWSWDQEISVLKILPKLVNLINSIKTSIDSCTPNSWEKYLSSILSHRRSCHRFILLTTSFN